MLTQRLRFQSLGLCGLVVVALVSTLPGTVAAQALYQHRLGNGTELIQVNLPLSEATSVSWPCADGAHTADFADPTDLCSISSGRLTLSDDLLAGLEAELSPFAPPVVIAVGAAAGPELRDLLDRVLARRSVRAAPTPSPPELIEGGLERRLGTAGSESVLRLSVVLPEPQDWRRAPVEVLWEILPALLHPHLPGLLSRTNQHFGTLEVRLDAQLAEVRLRSLRLALARIAVDPNLDRERIQSARLRLQVRRQAFLEQHPAAAEALLRLWITGGDEAIRHFLFGLSMVDLEVIREAAREWLPQHPGAAVLVLPPHVLNPRFAPAPQVVHLDNNLSVALLERPGTAVASISLRPVLLPDLDGDVSATILARLANELRSTEAAPGWIRVETRPASIELAVPPQSFAELCEVLVLALERITADQRSIAVDSGSARRRALQLLGGVIGLGQESVSSPAELLQPGNLAIGAVVPDAESAVEALHKIVSSWTVQRQQISTTSISSDLRTRAAVPGEVSVVAIAIPLPGGASTAVGQITAEVLANRARALFETAQIETFVPFIPGRRAVVVVASGNAQLNELEEALDELWPQLTAQLSDDELNPLRRKVAARLSVASSGSLGRARACAEVAAGAGAWRSPTEIELEVLTTGAQAISAVLAATANHEGVIRVGAGVLPIGGD